MTAELIRTEDGSLTCLDAETGELYHNRAGAYTEALENYFRPSAALDILARSGSLCLLDACFGLGYNTFVLLEKLLESGAQGSVSVLAVEMDAQILAATEHVLSDPRFALQKKKLAGSLPLSFGRLEFEHQGLSVQLNLVQDDLRQVTPDIRDDFDLVFHDPFSPRKVPELWTVDLFHQYWSILSTRGGKLATYSTAPAVLAGLRAAGFFLYRTLPVGGKRGGTLAVADETYAATDGVLPVTAEELARLQSRSGVPYRDPGLKSARADIFARRQDEQASQ